jgi:hypothetical protein
MTAGVQLLGAVAEKLTAEGGSSSGTQMKGNIHHQKPLPSNG